MKNLFDQQKRNKCQCGKTKNPNGNYDGSHLNMKNALKLQISTAFQTKT